LAAAEFKEIFPSSVPVLLYFTLSHYSSRYITGYTVGNMPDLFVYTYIEISVEIKIYEENIILIILHGCETQVSYTKGEE